MMKYIRWRIKSLTKSKFFIVPLILITAILIFTYIDGVSLMRGPENYFGNREEELSSTIDLAKHIQNLLDNEEIDSKSIDAARSDLQTANNRISKLTAIVNGFETGNWGKAYQAEVDLLDMNINVVSANIEDYGEDLQDALKREKLYFEYLRYTEIPYEGQITPVKGFAFMYNSFQKIVPYILIASLIYYLTFMYTKKYKGQVNIESTFPISKYKLYALDIVFGSILGVSIMLYSLIVSFLIGFFKYGTGHYLYPFMKYDVDGISEFASNVSVMIPTIILSMLSILFIVTMVYFFSSISRKLLATFAYLVLFFLATIYLSKELRVMDSFTHLLPMHYLVPIDVLSGELSFITKNLDFSVLTGIWSLIVSSVILSFANIVIIYRRGGKNGIYKVFSKAGGER